METTNNTLPTSIGLMAGYGAFPLDLAKSLQARGVAVHTVAAREETFPEIEKYSASTCWLHVGQLGGMIKAFKTAGVESMVFAGKVQKLHLFRNFRPDLTAIKTLALLPDRRDDTIMNAISDEVAKAGITVRSQIEFAADMLAGEGLLFGPKPSAKVRDDIAFGYRQAAGIAALDIGQTVVVRHGAVLAVESIEGTDEAIKRGGGFGNGKAVVVKVAKPAQDLRFDVPAFGADTLETMHASGCATLAVQADMTLMIEKQRIADLAKKYAITVYGYRPD
ncbi:MAG: UDP-2,3-diacylglucosamine diphosphatase LpxI [Mariprofundaceae bacterium]|nr:UDP-2,3-diacylglucosamine diphosphatase LpxI [Mariprofundaceae bacterium]